MKLSTIVFLLAVAPSVHSSSGGLRNLQAADIVVPTAPNCPDAECPPVFTNAGFHGPPPGGRFDASSFSSWEELYAFNGMTLPTLPSLNDVYDGFCQLCSVAGIVNLDQQFCFLCTLDFDGDGTTNETPNDLIDSIVPNITSCFSGFTFVQTPHGSVTMSNLQLGDYVMTASGQYERVYAWGHKHTSQTAKFIQFNGGLEMTGEHLVFLQGKTNPVRADSVKIGDFLQGAEVKSIKTIQRAGVYTPLTPSGTVVVNGISASSYISLQENAKEYVQVQGGFAIMSFHSFIHMALSPFRIFTMGVSSSMGNTYTDAGIPTFVSAAMDLAKWADHQNILVQAFLFLAFVAVAGTSMVVESVFGPSMAPLALGAAAGVYGLMKSNNLSVRATKVKAL